MFTPGFEPGLPDLKSSALLFTLIRQRSIGLKFTFNVSQETKEQMKITF